MHASDAATAGRKRAAAARHEATARRLRQEAEILQARYDAGRRLLSEHGMTEPVEPDVAARP